jgi:phenylacetate-CoA ligase
VFNSLPFVLARSAEKLASDRLFYAAFCSDQVRPQQKRAVHLNDEPVARSPLLLLQSSSEYRSRADCDSQVTLARIRIENSGDPCEFLSFGGPAPCWTARMSLLALAIRHVVYPSWELKNGSAHRSHLQEMERRQFWSAERLAEHQWSSFKRLVTHAVDTCPYYRESFRRAGLSPADLRSPEDIRWVPTLSKQEIQAHRDEMISSRYRREDLIEDMTGGSTGSPMRFYYDRERRETRAAAVLRHDRWSGWNIGERRALLWGAQRDLPRGLKARLRTRLINRTLALDASALDDAAMAQFAAKLKRYQPKVLVAYANTLALFARYVQAEKITGIKPQGIITSAEVLTRENRELIEKTFGCRVFDRYGCREFGVIASECSVHENMHISADNLLVETVAADGPCHGTEGEIVITDLRNLAMPMIRYQIKDVGRILPGACRCSRGLPLMELSGGRVTDFLTATDGRKVSGVVLATYVITRIPGIEQVQFVQSEPGAVTLNLVKGPDWSEHSTLTPLIAKAREYLGPDMRFDVSFRDRIPQEKSGKYRFAVSTL